MKSLKITLFFSILFMSLSAFAGEPGAIGESLKGRRGREDKLIMDLTLGASFRFVKVPVSANTVVVDYLSKLKNGFNANASVAYYFTDRGIGAMYDVFHTSNSLSPIERYNVDGTTDVGKLSDDIYINYYALTYNQKISNRSQSFTFRMTMGIGYLTFSNRGEFIEPVTIKGQSIGGSLHFAGDFRVADHFFIGVKAGILGGTLKDPEVNGITRPTLTGQGESLGRGSVGVVFRVSF